MNSKLLAAAIAVAEKAADLLLIDGWTRGTLKDRDGSRCYLGALQDARAEVGGYKELTPKEKHAITRMINRRVGRHAGLTPLATQQELIHWNDRVALEGDVQEAFRRTGKDLREKLGETQ